MKRINQCLLLLIISTRFLTINVQNLEAASLIGGQKVNVDEIKYLVSLQLDGEHFCGGSIIGERFILSAAHCVVNEHNKIDNKSIKVVAGTNDLNAKNLKAVKVDVKKIYVPSNYNDLEWETSIPSGDIAVLKLKKSLNIKNNTNLNKLRLPRRNKHYKGKYKSYVGDKVLIAGFGWDKVRVKLLKNKTEYEVGSSTDRLLSATAKVISNSACQEYYTNIIRENELCARVIEHDDDTPQGVCRGDSGGPLVYNHNTIIGVVSGISIGCNENNEPGVYSRVSSYMDFIRNALKDVTDNMLTRTF